MAIPYIKIFRPFRIGTISAYITRSGYPISNSLLYSTTALLLSYFSIVDLSNSSDGCTKHLMKRGVEKVREVMLVEICFYKVEISDLRVFRVYTRVNSLYRGFKSNSGNYSARAVKSFVTALFIIVSSSVLSS